VTRRRVGRSGHIFVAQPGPLDFPKATVVDRPLQGTWAPSSGIYNQKTLLAMGIFGFLVKPLGSKRVWLNFSTKTRKGTPYWRAKLMAVAKTSIRPLIVLPSLAMVQKSSPGVPSSKRPTVRYPSWPANENLWSMPRALLAVVCAWPCLVFVLARHWHSSLWLLQWDLLGSRDDSY